MGDNQETKQLNKNFKYALVTTKGFCGWVPLKNVAFTDMFGNELSRGIRTPGAACAMVDDPNVERELCSLFPDCVMREYIPSCDVYMPGEDVPMYLVGPALEENNRLRERLAAENRAREEEKRAQAVCEERSRRRAAEEAERRRAEETRKREEEIRAYEEAMLAQMKQQKTCEEFWAEVDARVERREWREALLDGRIGKERPKKRITVQECAHMSGAEFWKIADEQMMIHAYWDAVEAGEVTPEELLRETPHRESPVRDTNNGACYTAETLPVCQPQVQPVVQRPAPEPAPIDVVPMAVPAAGGQECADAAIPEPVAMPSAEDCGAETGTKVLDKNFRYALIAAEEWVGWAKAKDVVFADNMANIKSPGERVEGAKKAVIFDQNAAKQLREAGSTRTHCFMNMPYVSLSEVYLPGEKVPAEVIQRVRGISLPEDARETPEPSCDTADGQQTAISVEPEETVGGQPDSRALPVCVPAPAETAREAMPECPVPRQKQETQGKPLPETKQEETYMQKPQHADKPGDGGGLACSAEMPAAQREGKDRQDPCSSGGNYTFGRDAKGTGPNGETLGIRDFFAIHGGVSAGEDFAGFILVKGNIPCGMRTVCTAKPSEIMGKAGDVKMYEGCNYYFTRDSFSDGKHAKREVLRDYLNIAADIDAHGINPARAQELATKLATKVTAAAKEGLIPQPNTFMHTGRGIQVLWAVTPIDAKEPGAAEAYEEACAEIREKLARILDDPELYGLEYDSAASSNTGGLIRFPGSPNAKVPGWHASFEVLSYDARIDLKGMAAAWRDGQEAAAEAKNIEGLPEAAGLSAWLDYTWEEREEAKEKGAWFDRFAGHWYAPTGADLSIFAGHVIEGDVYALEKKFRKEKQEKDRQKASVPEQRKAAGKGCGWKKGEGVDYPVMGKCAAAKRVKSLDYICAKRKAEGRPFGDGHRDLLLLQYYCPLLRMGLPDDEVMRKIREINRSFSHPLGDWELRTYLSSAAVKKYCYGDRKVAKVLGLSEQECAEAGLSLNGYVDNETRKAEAKERKEERDRKIIELGEQGMTRTEIAGIVGVCRQTVSKVLRENGIELSSLKEGCIGIMEAIGKAAAKVLDGAKENIVKIAADLAGVSVSTVYRWLQKAGGLEHVLAEAAESLQQASGAVLGAGAAAEMSDNGEKCPTFARVNCVHNADNIRHKSRNCLTFARVKKLINILLFAGFAIPQQYIILQGHKTDANIYQAYNNPIPIYLQTGMKAQARLPGHPYAGIARERRTGMLLHTHPPDTQPMPADVRRTVTAADWKGVLYVSMPVTTAGS